MGKRGIFFTVGGLLIGSGLAGYIPPPTDPSKDLASFLYVLTSIPKSLINIFIVVGIILLGIAWIWDKAVSIWDRIIAIWNSFVR
jgi:hypothetical protein